MSGVSVSPLRVVGFTCDAGAPYDFSKDSEEPCSSSSPSTKQKLPESPLGRLLRSDRPNGFPKLTLKSLGNPSGSSAGHFGLNISRRAMSAAVLGEDVPAPITPSCSRLSSSSEPIPIPEYCRYISLELYAASFPGVLLTGERISFRPSQNCLRLVCRPFRTESQPDAPLSGGWSGSHPANYFACSNGGAPVSVERDHSAFCAPPAGSRPPSSHRLPLCTDSAEFEPVTPCRPEVLTRQRSLLGLGSSTTATRSSSSAATVASHVLDQHFSHLEARVARQVS